jgi:hypothetical protein
MSTTDDVPARSRTPLLPSCISRKRTYTCTEPEKKPALVARRHPVLRPLNGTHHPWRSAPLVPVGTATPVCPACGKRYGVGWNRCIECEVRSEDAAHNAPRTRADREPK